MPNRSNDATRREIRSGVRRWLRLALRRRDLTAAETDEEIRLHLLLRTQELMRQGLTPAVARVEAERRFGSLDDARHRLHTSADRRENRMRIQEWLDARRQDLRVAVRGLLRSPALVAASLISLALGIGANTAAFSLAYELLLRPLPVSAPEQLVVLEAPGPRSGRDSYGREGPPEALFSYPMYQDLAKSPEVQRVLVGIAAHRMLLANVSAANGASGHALITDADFVSGSYFPLLGVRPALGRLFSPPDDEPLGGRPEAVLSYAYWQTEFGGDSGVLGRTILMNAVRLTILGVAPEGFAGTTLGVEPRLYLPISMAGAFNDDFGGRAGFADRRWYWAYCFGRLRPAVSIESARRALNAAYRPMLSETEAPLQRDMSADALRRFEARTLTVIPGAAGQSALRATTRTPVLLLFGLTTLVVLIASANVANLLIARAAGRTTEMAVRVSLGAGRWRLIAQLLTEVGLLMIIGGAAGLLVAEAALRIMASLIPPASAIGAGANLTLTLRPAALLFTAALALGTALLCGLLPALHSTRLDLMTTIRIGSVTNGARQGARLRSGLVVVQMALSMALLIAAGSFAQSLWNVARTDLGLRMDHTVTFGLAPSLNGYSASRSRAVLERVEAVLQQIPGVMSVGAATVPLLTGSEQGGNVQVEGVSLGPDAESNVRSNEVGPRFFRALGIPILAGRSFTAADGLSSPKVAIVTEAFARRFHLGRDVVGRHLAFGGDPRGGTAKFEIEIVGLAADAKYKDLKEPAPALLYTPYLQDSTLGALVYYARTARPPEELQRLVPALVAGVDPAIAVVGLKTVERQVRESVFLDRMIGMLSAAFAALALLLASVGLYGVLSYSVAQRTREFGVRMALGADARRVRGLVLRQVVRLTLLGGAAGVVAALGFGRVMQTLLFGLTSHDARVIAASTGVLTIVALAAGFLPAWHASRIDPTRALRAD